MVRLPLAFTAKYLFAILLISSGLLNRFYARGKNIIRTELALASSMRFPNAQGYASMRARGRGPEAAVQQPNEIVELAEVPGAEARIVTEIWVLAESRSQ
jgi:hypothetical protein